MMTTLRIVASSIAAARSILFSVLIIGCQSAISTENITQMSDQQIQLEELFQQLKSTESRAEIELLQADIWQVWLDTGHPESNQWMAQGLTAMSDQEYDEAIDLFTQIIETQPHYAEGWNKRATAYYLRGNYKASIDDINHTLSLEARHFGALSGLVSIYRTIGDDRGALKTLERLAAIIPADETIQDQIQQVRAEMGIRNI